MGIPGKQASPFRFARNVAGTKHGRAVLEGAVTRNGVPLLRPYVWHNADAEREAEVAECLAAIRAQPGQAPALPDACDAFDIGPSPEWQREASAELTGPPPPPAPEPVPSPEPPGPQRCGECGYLLTRCACPGGPRFGEA